MYRLGIENLFLINYYCVMVLAEFGSQVGIQKEQPNVAEFESRAIASRVNLVRRNVHGDVIDIFASQVTFRAHAELLIRREKISQTVLLDLQRSADHSIGVIRQEIIIGGRYVGSPEDLVNDLNMFERATARAYLVNHAKPGEVSGFMQEWNQGGGF